MAGFPHKLPGAAEILNVSAAVGVCRYELRRRAGAGGGLAQAAR